MGLLDNVFVFIHHLVPTAKMVGEDVVEMAGGRGCEETFHGVLFFSSNN
jgi:hypothetical protein